MILLLHLLGDVCELALQRFNRFVLAFYLLPKAALFHYFLLLGDAKLVLERGEVLPRVHFAGVLGRQLLFSEFLPFLFLFLDNQGHLTTLLFQSNEGLVLHFHAALVLPLAVLQLTQVFLGLFQLDVQLPDLLFILILLAQRLQRFLLVFLHFDQRSVLLLQLLKDSLLVLLLVLKLCDLLDIV